jgi:hypothetical protein
MILARAPSGAALQFVLCDELDSRSSTEEAYSRLMFCAAAARL